MALSGTPSALSEFRFCSKAGARLPYSITSVARISIDCGTVRPSASAVLRLMTQLEGRRLLDRQIGGLGARVSAD
jgi:hypothetical protein